MGKGRKEWRGMEGRGPNQVCGRLIKLKCALCSAVLVLIIDGQPVTGAPQTDGGTKGTGETCCPSFISQMLYTNNLEEKRARYGLQSISMTRNLEALEKHNPWSSLTSSA